MWQTFFQNMMFCQKNENQSKTNFHVDSKKTQKWRSISVTKQKNVQDPKVVSIFFFQRARGR